MNIFCAILYLALKNIEVSFHKIIADILCADSSSTVRCLQSPSSEQLVDDAPSSSHPPCSLVLLPCKQGPWPERASKILLGNPALWLSEGTSRPHKANSAQLCRAWAAWVQSPVVKWEILPCESFAQVSSYPLQRQLYSRLLLSNRFHPWCVSKYRPEEGKNPIKWLCDSKFWRVLRTWQCSSFWSGFYLFASPVKSINTI